MTVTGAVTAELRPTGVYVPPFQWGAAEVPFVITTGGPSPTGGSSLDPNPNLNPSVSASGTSAADYAAAYLQAHMMSIPSNRYAVVLWCVLALISILYAVAHHVRLSGGSLGAGYTKWGMRRTTVFGRALPSNSILLTMALVAAIAVVLSLAGNDYIAPSSTLWDFSTSMARRAVNSSTAPSWTIPKALWTTGSRFGITAFALMPLVVLLALKAPPFAVFSLPFFTALYSDQLITFHRAAGWLIFGVTTAHVVLWTVQLFQDQYNGRAMWFTAFTSMRFIFGCTAYGCMCLLMLLSLRPVRKNQFEFFYIAHLVLVVATLVTSVLHHPVLWYWIAIAGGLWVGDRIWRAVRYGWLNSGASKAPVVNARRQKTSSNDILLEEFSDKMPPPVPSKERDYNAYSPVHDYNSFSPTHDYNSYTPTASQTQLIQRVPSTVSPGYPRQVSYGGYADGEIRPLGAYEHSHGYEHDYSHALSQSGYAQSSPRIITSNPYSPSTPTRPSPGGSSPGGLSPGPGARSPSSVLGKLAPPPPVPAGYAQAQLLPSRTIRLTIGMPRSLKHAPGQSVLLTLPDLSNIQSHPFTICNNDRNELVLLIKARRGLTRKLYDLVHRRSENAMTPNSKRGSVVPLATPVYVRARVDGPMGSSGRIRWNNFATVLIICGGSGVSFGLSVCEHLCKQMSNRDRFNSSNSKTRRVRFVWIVREYAEIGWAASALCRARQLVNSSQLQIDIYVTNAAPRPDATRYDEFAPPRPTYGQMPRSVSNDSIVSGYSGSGEGEGEMQYDTFEEEMELAGAQAIDLSLYEGDEDVDDPAEKRLSYHVQKDGKARRARNRMSARRISGAMCGNSGAQDDLMDGLHTVQELSSPVSSQQQGYTAFAPAPPSGPKGYHGDIGLGRPSMDRPSNPYAQDDVPRPSFDSVAPIQTSGVFQGHNPRNSIAGSQHTLDMSPYDESHLLVPGSKGVSFEDEYSPYGSGSAVSPSTPSLDASSMREAMAVMSRTQSMVLLQDAGNLSSSSALWIDEADYAAMSIMSELARSGRPKLGAIFDEEVERTEGATLVATCGPTKLNQVVRNLVSRNIHPRKILHGDRRGHIAIFSEDFES